VTFKSFRQRLILRVRISLTNSGWCCIFYIFFSCVAPLKTDQSFTDTPTSLLVYQGWIDHSEPNYPGGSGAEVTLEEGYLILKRVQLLPCVNEDFGGEQFEENDLELNTSKLESLVVLEDLYVGQISPPEGMYCEVYVEYGLPFEAETIDIPDSMEPDSVLYLRGVWTSNSGDELSFDTADFEGGGQRSRLFEPLQIKAGIPVEMKIVRSAARIFTDPYDGTDSWPQGVMFNIVYETDVWIMAD
jgi:hypothetical protein